MLLLSVGLPTNMRVCRSSTPPIKENLVVIGLPCNQFRGQEPGTAAEIQTFCRLNYGVDFPMSVKIAVKGDCTTPIVSVVNDEGEEWKEEFFCEMEFSKVLGG